MPLKADCSLRKADWEFVTKLTRVAHVHVLSYQVSINFDRSNRDLGTNNENRLQFPKNWSLEYVGINPSKYEDNHVITMTWRVFNDPE